MPTATASSWRTSISRAPSASRRSSASSAEAFEHDVRELASWERLLAAVGGDVYALVNNAARTEFRSFWEIDVEEWDDVLATNLRGTYLGCRVVGAALRERGAGRIVNLASVSGQTASDESACTTQPPRRRRGADARARAPSSRRTA